MKFSQTIVLVLNLLCHFSQLDTHIEIGHPTPQSYSKKTMGIAQEGNDKPLIEFSPTSKNPISHLIKRANAKRVKKYLNSDHEPLTAPVNILYVKDDRLTTSDKELIQSFCRLPGKDHGNIIDQLKLLRGNLISIKSEKDSNI